MGSGKALGDLRAERFDRVRDQFVPAAAARYCPTAVLETVPGARAAEVFGGACQPTGSTDSWFVESWPGQAESFFGITDFAGSKITLRFALAVPIA